VVSTWGSGYTCQGDEQGVAIHFSHTARGEGGPRDPRACLGHLQVMKEETAALHSEQHMHTASNQNEMARRPRKEWAYSPCTASPAGLLIATRSSVQKVNANLLSIRAKVFENGFMCSLTILVQHHAAFCCQRCFPAWLTSCIPERHTPLQSMATVEDHSESQLEHLTNVAESDFHQTDRNDYIKLLHKYIHDNDKAVPAVY